MFGFSIGKLLLLAVIGTVVWFFWRRIGQRPTGPARPTARRSPASGTETMEKCPRCGVYMASNAGRCGREDCPRAA